MRLLEIYFEGLARPVVVEFQGELPTQALGTNLEDWWFEVAAHLYDFAGSRRLVLNQPEKILAIVETTLTPPNEVIWKQSPEDPGVVGPVELETE